MRVLGLLILAFALGFVPPTLEKRRLEATLHATQLDLRLANLHRRLGVASEEAQRNNFASAAAAARDFFDGCRELAITERFPNQPRTRGAITAYGSYSESIQTQLTLADPQVKERLASLYLAMDGVLTRRE